jgi:hypothetical protein
LRTYNHIILMIIPRRAGGGGCLCLSVMALSRVKGASIKNERVSLFAAEMISYHQRTQSVGSAEILFAKMDSNT